MRSNLLFWIVVVFVLILFTAEAEVVRSDRVDRNHDTFGYNVLAERVFKGRVTSNTHIIGDTMYLSLRMPETVVEIQLGPKDFMARANFKVNVGDMVTVVGMPVVTNGREVVVAREVRSMNGSLTLRDRMGLPVWETNRPIQMDPERPYIEREDLKS